MRLLSLLAGLLSLASCHAAPDANENRGKLVIVGGGLRASNEAIYRSFIDGAQGGQIGIIPAASGKPAKYSNLFKEALISYGVSEDRIHILPIAVRDDSTTPSVDESQWARNAWNESIVEKARNLNAVWFTGGDQFRIQQSLADESGSDSPLLGAIRRMYSEGGTIGGTSAGAAIQSNPMILGGTSLDAFDFGSQSQYPGMESQENGPLVLGTGLGFFPHGIIDQHFERKARLGRLVVALLENEKAQRLGFGVDEDTALVYDAAQNKGHVVGSGTVVFVDAAKALATDTSLTGVSLNVLCHGDAISFADMQISVNPKKTVISEEYLSLQRTPL
ncbi:MAG: cyanophycinase, partial [Verrucomicrobiota bacterium]